MAFFSSTATVPQNLTFVSSNKLSFSPSSTTSFNFVSFPSFQSKFCKTITTYPQITRAHAPPAPSTETTTASSFHGLCYVVGDNIDTDQIIPAEHLTLVPSKPDEYQKLGSFALIGLPDSYTVRFVEPGETKTKYSIIIGGANFGCGSSREHAPVALGASGAAAVVAESYARIFFRNSVATGEENWHDSYSMREKPCWHTSRCYGRLTRTVCLRSRIQFRFSPHAALIKMSIVT
ncbi:hypothetical protein P8452_29985 [Trifolium repens]|nr:hypothetical protein P8452_29985 [Trifolium repens]